MRERTPNGQTEASFENRILSSERCSQKFVKIAKMDSTDQVSALKRKMEEILQCVVCLEVPSGHVSKEVVKSNYGYLYGT